MYSVQADGLATVKEVSEWGLSLDIQLQPKSLLPAASPGPQTYEEGSEWLQQGEGSLVVRAHSGKLQTWVLSRPGRQTWVKMLGGGILSEKAVPRLIYDSRK